MADLVTLDEVLAHLNLSATGTDTVELDRFIDAATAHFEYRFGALPSGTYTEALSVIDDGAGTYRHWLAPWHSPVTAVTSAADEVGTTSYTTGFVIATDGRRVRHPNIASGEWTLTYTAGQPIGADLKLAVLEDIRGLYQPGQIGPPGEFGAFGAMNETPQTMFRVVNLWPRIDAWVDSRLGPMIA